jgi:hypothetical protein
MFEVPTTIDGDPSIDVLESTGPVMLTRAYHAYDNLAEVNIVLPSLWQPISAHEGHTLHGLGAWKNETEKRGAYACHVWNCSTKDTTGGVLGMTSWAHQDPVVKKK